MRKILAASIATSLFTAAGGAYAATATTSFGVSATVLNCTVAATPLNFGNYTPGTGPLLLSTAVNVRCTRGTSFTVALNGGTTVGGTITSDS